MAMAFGGGAKGVEGLGLCDDLRLLLSLSSYDEKIQAASSVVVVAVANGTVARVLLINGRNAFTPCTCFIHLHLRICPRILPSLSTCN